eukprot:g1546.t1
MTLATTRTLLAATLLAAAMATATATATAMPAVGAAAAPAVMAHGPLTLADSARRHAAHSRSLRSLTSCNVRRKFCEDASHSCDKGYFAVYYQPRPFPLALLGEAYCRQILAPTGLSKADIDFSCDSSPPRLQRCFTCPMGKFQGSIDVDRCTNCAPGKFSSRAGAHECKLCAKGRYQVGSGRPNCIAPPGGHYVNQRGQTKYKPCQRGYHSMGGMRHEGGVGWKTESCAKCHNSVSGRGWGARVNAWYQDQAAQKWCKRKWCNRWQYLKWPDKHVCASSCVGRDVDSHNSGECQKQGTQSACAKKGKCRWYVDPTKCSAPKPLYTVAPSCINCNHPSEVCSELKRKAGDPDHEGWYRYGCWYHHKGRCAKCASCPAGRYRVRCGGKSHTNHGGHCAQCPAGKYKPEGTRNSIWSTGCTRCSQGTYQPFRGKARCSDCQRPACPDRTYRLNCGTGAYPREAVDKQSTSCPDHHRCDPDHYDLQNQKCKACKHLPMTSPGSCVGCPLCPYGKWSRGCHMTQKLGSGHYRDDKWHRDGNRYSQVGTCEVCGSHLPRFTEKYRADFSASEAFNGCPRGKWLDQCHQYNHGKCKEYTYKLYVVQRYPGSNPQIDCDKDPRCVEFAWHPYLTLTYQENKMHNCLQDVLGDCIEGAKTSFELRRQEETHKKFVKAPEFELRLVKSSSSAFFKAQKTYPKHPSTGAFMGLEIVPNVDADKEGLDFEELEEEFFMVKIEARVQSESDGVWITVEPASKEVPARVLDRNEIPVWNSDLGSSLRNGVGYYKPLELEMKEHDVADTLGAYIPGRGGKKEAELNDGTYSVDDDKYANNQMQLLDKLDPDNGRPKRFKCSNGASYTATQIFVIDCAGVIKSNRSECTDYDEQQSRNFEFIVRVTDPNPTLTYDDKYLHDDLDVKLHLVAVDEKPYFINTNFTAPYYYPGRPREDIDYIAVMDETVTGADVSAKRPLTVHALANDRWTPGQDGIVVEDPDGDRIKFSIKSSHWASLFDIETKYEGRTSKILYPAPKKPDFFMSRARGRGELFLRPGKVIDAEGSNFDCGRDERPALLSIMAEWQKNVCFKTITIEACDHERGYDNICFNKIEAKVLVVVKNANDPPRLAENLVRFMPENSAENQTVSLDKQGEVGGTLSPDTSDEDGGTSANSYEYSISGGRDAALFTIVSSGPDAGTLKAARHAFDYEGDLSSNVRTRYEVQVSVKDTGLQVDHNPIESSTYPAVSAEVPQTVTIVLTDVNEKPVIESGANALTVKENSAIGTKLRALKASDPDVDRNRELTWELLRQDCADCDSFSLDAKTGQLSITANSELDFEGFPASIVCKCFEIPVQVTDSEGLSDNTTITVTVEDVNEAPTMAVPSALQVDENAPGAQVALLCDSKSPYAFDIDTKAQWNTLKYTIASVSAVSDPRVSNARRDIVTSDKPFVIDSTTGCVTVGSAGLNYEKYASYDIVIEATDGEFTANGTAIVQVIDVHEAPELFFVPSQGQFADRNATVREMMEPGRTVGHFYTCDPDFCDSDNSACGTSLSVSRGTRVKSFSDDGTKFELVDLADIFELANQDRCMDPICEKWGRCNTVYRVQIRNKLAVPKYCVQEGKCSNVYQLPLKAVDKEDETLKNDKLFRVDKMNTFWPPTILNATRDFYISEYPRVDSAHDIANVVATDVDDEETLTYHLSTSYQHLLVMNSSTGAIRVNNSDNSFSRCQTRCSCPLDFECKQSISVPVSVTDGRFVTESMVVLNIQDIDEPPYFLPNASGLSYEIEENSSKGDALREVDGKLVVADPDLHDTNSQVTFSLSGTDAALFAIEPQTGALSLKPNVALDFEGSRQPAEYEISIDISSGAKDQEKNASRSCLVSVLDVNEQPVFPSGMMKAFSVSESAEEGTVVGTVKAVDVDDENDVWGELEYSIMEVTAQPLAAGASNDTWGINDKGELKLMEELDYETAHTHIIKIKVEDGGEPRLFDVVTVTVTVIDVDDATLDAVAGAVVMATTGGQGMTLTGTNLIPKWDHDTKIRVTYGRGHYEVEAQGCTVKKPGNTQVECSSAPGAGTAHTWLLRVEKHHSATFAATTNTHWLTESSFTTSYAPPNVTSLSASASVLSTTGGDKVIVYGHNFGPLGTNVSAEVQINNGVPVPECSVKKAHTEIECISAEGAGVEHAWRVTVQDQPQEAWSEAVSSYALPVIRALDATPELHGTPGDDMVVLNGENFGPVNIASDTCEDGFCYVSSPVVTYGATGTEYVADDCYISHKHTKITCWTVPGVGANLKWVVKVGEQTSAASVAVTSYQPPSIRKLQGAAIDAPILTDGGQRVVIIGQNLGPDAATLIGRYGKTGSEMEANDMTGASSCKVVRPHEQVECVTIPGTGRNLTWSVTVGGQRSVNSDDRISYGQPVLHTIKDVDGEDVAQPTWGNVKVVLRGRNFGPASLSRQTFEAYGMTEEEYRTPRGKIESISYGECDKKGNCRSYEARDCNITKAHLQIECWTVAGVGSQQKWVVRVAGQSSTNPTTDYLPPTITNITAVDSDTLGGTKVLITGTNFGDEKLAKDDVTYGLTGEEYVATCTVAEPHTALSCVTAPGWGRGLFWKVKIGGQQTLPDERHTTSYAKPVILKVEGGPPRTSGGTVLTITGQNFGPAGTANVRFTKKVNNKEGPITRVAQGVQEKVNELKFTVPEGYGEYDISVLVGRRKLQNPMSESEVRHVGAYDKPRISRVQKSYSVVQRSDVLHIYGDNFGPATDSRNGKPGQVELELISLPTQCDRIEWSHIKVSCYVPLIMEGKVRVAVKGVWSNQIEFTSYQPELVQFDVDCMENSTETSNRDCPPARYYEYYPENTDPNNQRNAQLLPPTVGRGILRLAVGSVGSNPRVTVGGRECRVPEGGYVEELKKLLCHLPEGQGTGVEILVFRQGQSQSSIAQLINYKPPTIDWAKTRSAGNNDNLVEFDQGRLVVGTEGVANVTVTGKDLGISGAVITANGKKCDVRFQNHTHLTFDVPPGEGTGYVLMIDIAGNKLMYDFAYAEPVVTKVSSSKAGLTLAGRHFGTSAQLVSVKINGELCSAGVQAAAFDDRAFTFVPQCGAQAFDLSKDTGLEFQVTVAGQHGYFYAPTVQSVTAPQARDGKLATKGGDEVRVTGEHFLHTATVTVGGKPCTGVIVAASKKELTCTAPAGQGLQQEVQVRAGELLSSTSPANSLDYHAPTIQWDKTSTAGNNDNLVESSASKLVVGTEGVGNVTISGTDLGISGAVVTAAGKDCKVQSQSQTHLTFDVPAGQGSGFELEINVAGNKISHTFAYSQPVVAMIASTESGDLKVTGRHFGVSYAVTINDVACAQAATQDHRTLVFTPACGQRTFDLKKDTGLQFTVTVAGQDGRFSAPSVTKAEALTVAPTAGKLNTAGGDTVSVTGEHFLHTVSVTVGGKPCTGVVVAPSKQELTCTAPPSAGLDQKVQVRAGELLSLTPHALDYAAPTITGVSAGGLPKNTDGTTLITISGDNFGILDGTVRLYGSNPPSKVTVGGQLCNPTNWTDTEIICYAPEWHGVQRAVIVKVAAQKNVASQAAEFSYDAPVITGIWPQNGPTSGEVDKNVPYLVTLTGTNFGNALAAQSGRMRLEMTNAKSVTKELYSDVFAPPQTENRTLLNRFVSANHTHLVFKLPADPGRGASRKLRLTLATQQAVSSESFAYNPPLITSVRKTVLRTDGTDERGGDARITISGANFGEAEPDQLAADGSVRKQGRIHARVVMFQQPKQPLPCPSNACTGQAPCTHNNDGSCVARVGDSCPAGTRDCAAAALFWDEVYLGRCSKKLHHCKKCDVLSVDHNEIVCEPRRGQGTWTVAVLRSPSQGKRDVGDERNLCADRTRCFSAINFERPIAYDGAIVTSIVGDSKRPAACGDTITITGENFGDEATPAKVTFHNQGTTIECKNPLWTPAHPTDTALSKPYVTCEVDEEVCMVAGFKNLSVVVAEQEVALTKGGGAVPYGDSINMCTGCMQGSSGECIDPQTAMCSPAIVVNGAQGCAGSSEGPCEYNGACFPYLQNNECPPGTKQRTQCADGLIKCAKGVERKPQAQGRRLEDANGVNSALVSTGGFLLMGCRPGWFAQPGEKCVECVEGMDCTKTQLFDGSHFGEPSAKPGFFLSSTGSRDDYACLQPDRAVCLQVVPCEPADACLGDNTCEEGYTDTRCATCAKGYYRLNGACDKCPKCSMCAFLFFLFFAIVLCVGGHWLAQKKVKLNMLSIFIDYFQIISILAMSNTIKWPSTLKKMFSMLSFFNLNLDLMAPECSYPTVPYAFKWSMIMSLPIFAVMFFLAVHMAIWFKKRCIQKRTKDLHRHIHLMIGTSLIAFYYFYLYLTKTALDIFNCSPTTPPEVRPDGTVVEYLEVTFAECSKPGGLQMRLVGPAAAYFTLYSIGFPAVVGTLLYKNREKCKEDQLLRAKRSGNSRATNPNCWEFRKKYHKIYEMYKPQYYYWSAAIMGRKLLIACSGLLFRRSPVFLLAFSLLTLFVAYAMQVRNQPFMHDLEYEQVIEQAEKEAAKKSKHFGGDVNLSTRDSGSAASKTRSKVRRMGEGPESGEVSTTNGVRKAIYNYNSIESTLLFCAILIVLSALMFQSDAIKPGSKWESGLTLWTFVIVMFSIVFFVAVVGTEIVVGLGIWDAAKARKKLGLKNEDSDSDSDSDDDLHLTQNNMARHDSGENPMFRQAHGGGSNTVQTAAEQKAMQDTIAHQKAEILRLKKVDAAGAAANMNFAQKTAVRNVMHPKHHHHQRHPSAGSRQVTQQPEHQQAPP